MKQRDAGPWILVIGLIITSLIVGYDRKWWPEGPKPIAWKPLPLASTSTVFAPPRISSMPMKNIVKKLSSAKTETRRIMKDFLAESRNSKASIYKTQWTKNWADWTILEPGIYVFNGAQFTLKHRAKIKMFEGIVNVVEL